MVLLSAGLVFVAGALSGGSPGGASAAFVLVGAATGALDAAVNVLPLWTWGAGLDVFMQATHVAFTVGAALSPLVTAAALAGGDAAAGARAVLLGLAAFTLALAPASLCVSSPADPAAGATDDEADGGALASRGAASGIRGLRAFVARGDLSRSVVIGALLFACVGAEVGFGGLIGTYSLDVLGASDADAALLVSVFWGGMAGGRALAIPIAAVMPPQAMLLGSAGCGLGGCALLAGTRSYGGAAGAAALVGLAVSSMFPTSLCLPPRLGLAASATLTGLFIVGGTAGGAAVPSAAAAAMAAAGPRALPGVVAAAFGVTLGALLAARALVRARPPGATARGGDEGGALLACEMGVEMAAVVPSSPA